MVDRLLRRYSHGSLYFEIDDVVPAVDLMHIGFDASDYVLGWFVRKTVHLMSSNNVTLILSPSSHFDGSISSKSKCTLLNTPAVNS